MTGLGDEQVAAAITEVEAGYDLTHRLSEPNSHFHRLQLVPADLLDGVEERAMKEGPSAEDVVRQALTRYLHTA